MIPEFNQRGCRPAGVHPATVAEIEDRFGSFSKPRRVQMESVRWMVDLARRAGVVRIVLNGSFVTDIMEPNDVDCVLLMPEDLSRDPEAVADLVDGLPFLDVALVDHADFEYFTNWFFLFDRLHESKGMLEVISWH